VLLSQDLHDSREYIVDVNCAVYYTEAGILREVDGTVDIGDVNCAVYLSEDSCLCVVVDQRLCLLVVYAQSLKHGLRLVIISQDETAAAFVAHALNFCRSILDMVCRTAVYTGSSAAHAVYDVVVRNFYIDGVIHLLAHSCEGFVKRLRLR